MGKRFRSFTLASTAIATIAMVGLGCSNELETGYTPRALNSSSTVRRGYYASPFTPEAQAAQSESGPDADIGSHRAKPGY